MQNYSEKHFLQVQMKFFPRHKNKTVRQGSIETLFAGVFCTSQQAAFCDFDLYSFMANEVSSASSISH